MPFQAWIRGLLYLIQQSSSRASMGPCPFRHGYPSPSCHMRGIFARFNGAMPFQAWIRRASRIWVSLRQSFNGAMPFQAWILCQGSTLTRPRERFNGAMPFQAWIQGIRSRLRGSTVSASMGPCPFRHGYLRQLGFSHREVAEASMGPCPFRHGYSIFGGWCWSIVWGFNGAMPFQAWIRGYLLRRLARDQTTLQWGHALSGMDTTVGRTEGRHSRGFNGAMPFQAWIPIDLVIWLRQLGLLQWGHALSGMDTSHHFQKGKMIMTASMGPCPFRHGYAGIAWGMMLSSR